MEVILNEWNCSMEQPQDVNKGCEEMFTTFLCNNNNKT